MVGFIGEVVTRKPGAVVVSVPGSACGSACGCGGAKAQLMELPSIDGAHLRITMAPRDQWILLMNTLLLPLGGFLAGASLAYMMAFNDLLAFGGALVGLGLGMAMCRRQSLERVVIEEVSGNE